MSRSSNFRSQRSNRDDQLDEILNPQEFNVTGGRENRFRDNDNDQLNVTIDLTSQSGSVRDWCLREDDGQGIFGLRSMILFLETVGMTYSMVVMDPTPLMVALG